MRPFVGCLIWCVTSLLFGQNINSGDLQEWARELEKHELVVDAWRNLEGDQIKNLRDHENFPKKPDRTYLLNEEEERFKIPNGKGTDMGYRIRGAFTAPVSGTYRFRLTAKDQAESWIEIQGKKTKLVQIRKPTPELGWNATKNQRSKPVKLKQGHSYPIEILMKHSGGEGHLAMGVEFPDGRQEFPVRSRRFVKPEQTYSFTQDRDEDGLSEYEEWVVGSDPDNASTAGDGIPDSIKLTLNLDLSKPFEGELPLPIEWAFQHNLELKPQVRWQDPDRDGLQNWEEHLAGGDPHNADTSGDGTSDFAAYHLFGTSAQTVIDPEQGTLAVKIDGNAYKEKKGIWQLAEGDSAIVNYSSNGSVTFAVPTRRTGPQLVELDLEVLERIPSPDTIWVQMATKGVPVSRQPFFFKQHPKQTLRFLLPASGKGWEDVTFSLENVNTFREITLHQLRVVSFPDSPETWQQDWYTNTLVLNEPLTSRVSPACIEGTSLYPDEVTAVYSTEGRDQSLPVHRLPYRGWFLDLPLAESGKPTSLTVQQPMSGITLSQEVEWTSTNVLTEELPVIRTGDSLRLVSHPEQSKKGEMSFRIGDKHYGKRPVSTPLIHRFQNPGVIEIKTVWESEGETREQTRSLTVLAPPNHPPLFRKFIHVDHFNEKDGPWEATVRDEKGRYLETDPLVKAVEKTTNHLQLHTSRPGQYFMATRVHESGPVLSVRRVEIAEVHFPRQFHIALRDRTGVGLAFVGFTLSRIPEGLIMPIKMLNNERTLLNGETHGRLDTGDVDDTGKVIIPASASRSRDGRGINYDVKFKLTEVPK